MQRTRGSRLLNATTVDSKSRKEIATCEGDDKGQAGCCCGDNIFWEGGEEVDGWPLTGMEKSSGLTSWIMK